MVHVYATCYANLPLVVCADGGATHALAAGVHPRVIVGDLDSVEPSVLAHWQGRGVEVVRHPVAKDETDLELAIAWAIDHGARTSRCLPRWVAGWIRLWPMYSF